MQHFDAAKKLSALFVVLKLFLHLRHNDACLATGHRDLSVV
jgi:hypothetical protein